LKIDEILGDLTEGAIEDRHLVFNAEPNVGVLIEGALARGIDVRRLQGDRLVTVCLGDFDSAVPLPVLDICAAEDDQSGLEFLGIDKEGHAPPVQNLCFFST
jgi:hypothetical protein